MENHTPSLTALASVDDHLPLARLAPRLQKRVLKRLDCILKIEDAEQGKKGLAVSIAAAELKVSIPTVHRFLRAYREEGWQGLIDRRGGNTTPLPPAFEGFVKERLLLCQRATSVREVRRQTIERWMLAKRTGDPQYAIPGYDTPPPAGPQGWPQGWSIDTFYRLRPDKYALTIARQGAKKAAGFLPSILKTRVGTPFGGVVLFDDQDLDVKVVARGVSQRALRPQGFACLDYLSGCFMHHAERLRWWDDERNQYRTLTSEDFSWFVISYLQKHGYRSDSHGTCLVMEHGTATGWNNKSLSTFGGFNSFDDALAGVSYGCIRIERGGLFNSPAFAQLLFRPQSSGNPNRKAAIESMFSLVRSRMAALPGAVGRNRDEKPAEQFGMDIYSAQLLRLYERLDPRQRELIRFPMMTSEEFASVINAVFDAINARDDHALEGWEECGFISPQFRFTPDDRSPWMTRDEVMALPDDARAALLANADRPGYVRSWKLSPIEVARQCAGELTKLPDHAIPLLLPSSWARPATVKSDRTISIKDQLLGPEAFHYVARIEDRDGARVLQAGTKLLCFLNPFNTERLVICREDGAYLGTLQQMTRAGWSDHTAIEAQLKERAAMKADLSTGVRPHLTGLMESRTEMKRVNDRLKAGKPVLPEDVAQARTQAGKKGQSTAAANRLQSFGNAIDWDNYQPEEDAETRNAWDALPKDYEIPDAL